MISPEEIKLQAQKWWKPLLQSHVHHEPFFPKQIERIGKIQPAHITHRFEALKNELDILYRFSKNETGTGYTIKTSGKNFRRTGTHELPDSIEIETADDYLQFTGKKKEWKLFIRNYGLLAEALPRLQEWIAENVLFLTLPDINWPGVLKVCHYFIGTPRPGLYLRQLPVQVHTKFIEENNVLLQSLLNFLIPGDVRNGEQKRFAERYFLKHDEPLIRIRILDEKLAVYNHIMDISILLSDFEKTAWDCEGVLITENKMNFLTLPFISSAIAIWSGGGFNISHLKNAGWLSCKRIFYWGDIDEHGFQLLHQIRSYFPQTKSVLMDKHTFSAFQQYAVQGERSNAARLAFLNEDEAALFDMLKSLETGNRLEQERIPQYYADAELSRLCTYSIS